METLNVMNLRRTKKSATRLPKPYIRKMLKSQARKIRRGLVSPDVKSKVTVSRSADRNGHRAEGRNVEAKLGSSPSKFPLRARSEIDLGCLECEAESGFTSVANDATNLRAIEKKKSVLRRQGRRYRRCHATRKNPIEEAGTSAHVLRRRRSSADRNMAVQVLVDDAGGFNRVDAWPDRKARECGEHFCNRV